VSITHGNIPHVFGLTKKDNTELRQKDEIRGKSEQATGVDTMSQ